MLSFLWKRKRDRRLFNYWDGKRERHADPLQLQMKIDAHPTCRWDYHPTAAEAGDLEAWAIVMKAICDVFSVSLYSEDTQNGLTQLELIELLESFSQFQENLKKNIGVLPSWRRSTAESTSQSSNAETTKDTSDSSSTST